MPDPTGPSAPQEPPGTAEPGDAEGVVREYLRRCLTILEGDPVLRSKVFFERGKALTPVLISVPGEPGEDVRLTECEQHVLALLVLLDKPMPAEKIRDTLEDR